MYILLPSCQCISELHYTAGIHKSSHPMGSFTTQFNMRGLNIPGCQTCGEALALHHTGQTATDFSSVLKFFFLCPRALQLVSHLQNVYSGLRSLAHITVRDFKHILMPRQCLVYPSQHKKEREIDTNCKKHPSPKQALNSEQRAELSPQEDIRP